MTHWGVEVFDLECVNGNWQMPAFPSSLMVCDVETGEALYPALGGAGGRTIGTLTTIAAVAGMAWSGGSSLFLAAPAKGAIAPTLLGSLKAAATTSFSAWTPAMGLAVGSVAAGVVGGLVMGGGVAEMLSPTIPPMPTFAPYEEAPGLYDPAVEAQLNQEAQQAAYQEQVSEYNRRRQRFVSMKDERQPLGGSGALVPETAVRKQQLLGA